MAKQKPESGWKEVSTSAGAPFVNWKKGKVVRGIVQGFREYQYKRKPHQCMEVTDTDTGETVGVNDHYSLLTLFKTAKPGDMVEITHLGVKKLKGRQTLHQFKVRIKAGKK